MATLSLNNGLSTVAVAATVAVAELNDDEIRILIDNIGLLDRDENYLKADAAAECSDNNREWAEKFVEAYDGEIIIG